MSLVQNNITHHAHKSRLEDKLIYKPNSAQIINYTVQDKNT